MILINNQTLLYHGYLLTQFYSFATAAKVCSGRSHTCIYILCIIMYIYIYLFLGLHLGLVHSLDTGEDCVGWVKSKF